MAGRRLVPALLAAVVGPVAVFGSVLVAVPGAGTGPAAWAAQPPAATAEPSPTPTPTPGDPPGAPTNLVATEVRTDSVTISWTPATPGCCPIAEYHLSVLPAFSDVITPYRLGGDATSLTFRAWPTSEFRISLSARDTQGTYSPGATLRVVTPATDTGPDTTPPQAPTDLAARDASGWGAELTWSAATDDVGVTGYQVYWFDGWYTSRLLATVTGTSHRVSLAPGRNLFYVRAVDAAGNVSLATPTISFTGTGPQTPTPSTTPVQRTCHVDYAVSAQWRGGFIAEVTVHNVGAAPVDGWTLAFDLTDGQRVRSAWNARYTQSGATVTARDLRWNRLIPAGGSVSFGIMASWTGGNAPPTGFTLNGGACATG
ncbi:cellulose binding domain-containing protein [Solwaraspora sp. WMMD1047]|uniref:cellulose binding domain-containing protein n=1 Tax=Solwaraspora sp. WMMD1047 TaxID=3016102 RepID=UPI00241598AF|nr:cellulose binding domain-containing protein [Solwaraspora sp. WMMD1047]MDG4829809.1 cellulose binding domain-containing protein [Solwaraspora sp. WMMD1047]